MHRSAPRLLVATVAMAFVSLAAAQTPPPAGMASSGAMASGDMAASGTRANRMKRTRTVKKDAMADKHKADDQNTSRSGGAVAGGPSRSMKSPGTPASGPRSQ